MPNFTRKSLPLFIAISLSGCASNRVQVDIDPVPEPVVSIIVPECAETQRDLTIPWFIRRYWCAISERKDDLQRHNDGVVYTPEVIEQINSEANEPDYTPIVEQPLSRSGYESSTDVNMVAFEFENESDASSNISSNDTAFSFSKPVSEVSDLVVTERAIIFAHNLISLGPQGRRATASLIEKAKSADSVKLRGLILPDEVLVDSDLYRETLSVGRALAVRDYWEQNGVDISHVTILHHNPDVSGRVVEVRFNG